MPTFCFWKSKINWISDRVKQELKPCVKYNMTILVAWHQVIRHRVKYQFAISCRKWNRRVLEKWETKSWRFGWLGSRQSRSRLCIILVVCFYPLSDYQKLEMGIINIWPRQSSPNLFLFQSLSGQKVKFVGNSIIPWYKISHGGKIDECYPYTSARHQFRRGTATNLYIADDIMTWSCRFSISHEFLYERWRATNQTYQ